MNDLYHQRLPVNWFDSRASTDIQDPLQELVEQPSSPELRLRRDPLDCPMVFLIFYPHAHDGQYIDHQEDDVELCLP